MLAARALGDRAKLIEGTAETVALPAPDPDDKPKRPNKVMDAADTALGPKERKPRKRAIAWRAPNLASLAATRGGSRVCDRLTASSRIAVGHQHAGFQRISFMSSGRGRLDRRRRSPYLDC